MSAAASFLPTGEQALLLQACLFEGEEALAAWREWRAGADLDTIDEGSARLLPMLAARLGALGVEDGQFGKYRGLQRRSWAKNQMLFRQAEALFAVLEAARVPALALKGLALAGRYYPEMAMRPMSDLDVMIRPDDAFRAFAALEAAGWACKGRRPRDRADLAVRHAADIIAPGGGEMAADLHWRLLPAVFSDAGDAALWAEAERFTIGAASGWSPSAADLLLHTCAHGARFNGVPPIRWVVDAAMLVRSGKVDWEQLLRQSGRYRLALPLGAALGYLRDSMRVAVPAAVTDTLTLEAPRRIERTLFRLDQRPFDRRPASEQLRMHLHIARHALRHGPAGYVRYFNRLRAGRSIGETLRWISDRVVRGLRT